MDTILSVNDSTGTENLRCWHETIQARNFQLRETRTLAEWVSGLRYEDIPDDVLDHARRFVLDNFGCQIAGATLPWSRTYYDMMRETRSGTHSTVAYYGDKRFYAFTVETSEVIELPEGGGTRQFLLMRRRTTESG